MKRVLKGIKIILCMLMILSGCSNTEEKTESPKVFEGATIIHLSDDEITVDGEKISENQEDAVYKANDIVYYQANQGFTYGKGTEQDEHTDEEADAHTVVHISKAGTYAIDGTLSKGQIAIDLGKEAEDDPEAVVNLILNGVDVTCTVAPAVIFYHVYECGSDDEESATKDVDTSLAGANVLIADDTINNISGSYVARIYKPETVELNEDETEVVSAKKLHKYDGAFYSKQSMNVNGDTNGTGILNIYAENEGLDSELHLTINGGNINIVAGNDGINTNEDNVSVTTINGGTLNIVVEGSTGEGDGIDSNGWLVINGGTVISQACSSSMDSGIDSDMGIYINGGTVIATGNMLDHISGGEQNFATFTFSTTQNGKNTYTLKNQNEETILEFKAENDFSILVVSSDKLVEGEYSFWKDDVQLTASKGQMMGMGGFRFEMPDGQMPDGELPDGMERPEMPNGEMFEGMERPEMPNGEMPEEMERPEMPDGEMHEGTERPEMPDGEMPEGMERPEMPNGEMPEGMESSEIFVIEAKDNNFSNVKEVE